MKRKTNIQPAVRGHSSFPKRVPRTKEINLKLDRIGNVIREARLNQGLTQEELAELIDVTPAYIGHIERNQRSFSLQILVKLATELELDMNYLFSDTAPTDEDKIIIDFKQLINGKPLRTQKAVLDIVRTSLKYL
jgi:transcriptional regulator with XRE-family HTH domain